IQLHRYGSASEGGIAGATKSEEAVQLRRIRFGQGGRSGFERDPSTPWLVPRHCAQDDTVLRAVAIRGIVSRYREMRVLTYNVHSCIGADQKLAPERIAGVIARMDADVVCLQELDLRRARTKHEDQAAIIAEMLGMAFFEFHPTISREPEHFGDAILSRHPLTLKRKATLPPVPNPIPNEKRGAIWVEIEVGGMRWSVVNTHFGLGREERWLQAKHFASDWIAPALPGPLVVCGDFNS